MDGEVIERCEKCGKQIDTENDGFGITKGLDKQGQLVEMIWCEHCFPVALSYVVTFGREDDQKRN